MKIIKLYDNDSVTLGCVIGITYTFELYKILNNRLLDNQNR